MDDLPKGQPGAQQDFYGACSGESRRVIMARVRPCFSVNVHRVCPGKPLKEPKYG